MDDFNTCMNTPVKQMDDTMLKGCINKLLFKPDKSQTDRELFTTVVLGSKAKQFKFLEGYTKWRTVGSWRDIDKHGNVISEYPDENNVLMEVEFKDRPDEGVGKRLVDNLFPEFNKRFVKEDLLYTRTIPVEESSLGSL